jgi:hypothetical protein
MDGTRRLRCLFYALSVVAESPSTRHNGVVMVSVVGKNTRKAALGKDTSARGLALIRSEVIPARVVAGHVVIMENRPLLSTFAALVLGVAEKLHVLKGQIFVHNNGTPEAGSLLKRLQEHGLDMEAIPTVPLGGLFSLGCFRAWVEDRIRHETTKRPGAGVASSSASSDAADAAITEEDEDEMRRKKKRIDAAYCRRKRFKKKIEREVIQAEAERLRLQNVRLREEGAALERYIQEARQLVERYEVGMTVVDLPLNYGQVHRGHLPPADVSRAGICGASGLPGASCAHDALAPSESWAGRAADEITWAQLLQAKYGGVNNRLLSTYEGLDEPPAPHNLPYAGMPNLSLFGYLPTCTSQGDSASEAVRFSDWVSDTLLQQQANRNRLLAAARIAGSSRNQLAPTTAAGQAPAFAEVRTQNRDPIDPSELALLELCGALEGRPRLV